MSPGPDLIAGGAGGRAGLGQPARYQCSSTNTMVGTAPRAAVSTPPGRAAAARLAAPASISAVTRKASTVTSVARRYACSISRSSSGRVAGSYVRTRTAAATAQGNSAGARRQPAEQRDLEVWLDEGPSGVGEAG